MYEMAASSSSASRSSVDHRSCLTMLCLPFCGDYEAILGLCTALIYLQILCSLLGSIASESNGVLLLNLAVGIYGLIAIDSRSHYLSRTYAVLFVCSVALDIAWITLYALQIWNFDPEKYGPVFVFLHRLALATQMIGFLVRIFSSLMWIQIIRLGVSTGNAADSEVRVIMRCPVLDDNLEDAIKVEKPHGKGLACEDESRSAADVSKRKSTSGNVLKINDAPEE